jgi:hypothetical protein
MKKRKLKARLSKRKLNIMCQLIESNINERETQSGEEICRREEEKYNEEKLEKLENRNSEEEYETMKKLL